MNIAVLTGGWDPERFISLRSASAVCQALVRNGHRVCPIDIALGADQHTEAGLFIDNPAEFAPEIPPLSQLSARLAFLPSPPNRLLSDGVMAACRAADLVFLALHGQDGEDGRLQAALDAIGCPFTGASWLGSALAYDKQLSKTIMRRAGIASPGFVAVSPGDRPSGQLSFDGAWKVVKPARGGSSIGVSVAKSRAQLLRAVEGIVASGKTALVEEYIHGREFTVGVLGSQVLPVIEIHKDADLFDHDAKYRLRPRGPCKAERPLDESEKWQIEQVALSVHRELKLAPSGYSRTDFLKPPGGPFMCLETNAPPALSRTSGFPSAARAAGLSFEQMCEKIVQLGVHRATL